MRDIKKEITLLEQIIKSFKDNGILYQLKKTSKEYQINYKILNSINEQSNKELTNLIEIVFEEFKEDIFDLINKRNKESKTQIRKSKRNYVAEAIKTLMYIKDKRSLYGLKNSVEEGWRKEEELINLLKRNNIDAKLNGNDKDREHKWFSFDSKPDFIIEGKIVEYQEGYNNFFKYNKLNKNRKNYILFKDNNLGFHLFNPKEIKELLQTREKKFNKKL